MSFSKILGYLQNFFSSSLDLTKRFVISLRHDKVKKISYVKCLLLKISFFLLIILSLNAVDSQLDEELVPNKLVNDSLNTYIQEERELIEKDHKNILELLFYKKVGLSKYLQYIGTAGAPGSGKSTFLQTYLNNHPSYVLIDIDQILKSMINTYVKGVNSHSISQNISYKQLLEKEYLKWRGASNYIANKVLNKVYNNKFSIAQWHHINH